jgi:hypothetical protein
MHQTAGDGSATGESWHRNSFLPDHITAKPHTAGSGGIDEAGVMDDCPARSTKKGC